MTNKAIILLAAKGLAIWLALSLAGFFVGDKLIHSLLPFYETVSETASKGYAANIDIKEDDVVLYATALKAQPITPERSLPAGTTIQSSITVLHALVPIVILSTIILTWPANNLTQRGYLIATLIPAVLIISALTVPIQLLGQLEIGFQNAAVKAGLAREEPFVLTWMVLTEGGGRWLIPALTGLACCGLVTKFSNS
ncbi:hypothetical protein N9W57_05160 [Pseudomonadales bacterium]|nr:hypothetical protein [Pseudomonadales bacterium]MDG1938392.1 hypothetical protein [Pseudomonadales bacterium]